MILIATGLYRATTGEEPRLKFGDEIYFEPSDVTKFDFERLRRITGYLVDSLDCWNDDKKAEEAARVKHFVNSAVDDYERAVRLEKTGYGAQYGLCELGLNCWSSRIG